MAKKEEVSAEQKQRNKAINDVLGKINKKFGAGSVSFLKDIAEELKVTFIKTPSYELNSALGGGLGRKKIIELYGVPSCGKTSLAFEVIAEEQKRDKNFYAAWIETENSIDPDYIASFGIDMDRFVLVQQDETLSAESCLEIVRSLVNSGQIGLIVLNSAAALLPKTEIESEFEKQNIGLLARLLSKALKAINAMLNKNNCTWIIINQVRTNIGSYAGGTISSGGLAIPFFSTQRIEMRKVKIDAGDPIGVDDGVKINCKIVKNRLAKGNPYKQCQYYAVYGKGIDSVNELSIVLVREGILTRAGAWLKLLDNKGNVKVIELGGEKVECKWGSKAIFTDAVKDSPLLLKYFEDEIDKLTYSGKIASGLALSEEEIVDLENKDSLISSEMKDIDEEE